MTPALTLVEPWEAEEVGMEVRALKFELTRLGHELAYWSRLLMCAVILERSDITEEAAGRLAHISNRVIRQGGAS